MGVRVPLPAQDKKPSAYRRFFYLTDLMSVQNVKKSYKYYFKIISMNISKEIREDLTAVISLSIKEEDYKPQVEQELKKYRKDASVKGFRKGKAPMGLIKKMAGSSVTVQEIDKLVSRSLSDFITKEEMSLLGQPLPAEGQEPLDIDNNTEHKFNFEVGIAPEVEVSLDKRTKIPYYTIKIDDELVNKEKDKYLQQFGSMKQMDNTGEKSYLKADIKQSNKDGEIVEDGILSQDTTLAVDIIKDEDIKKQFIDKAAGDSLTVDLKKAYPNDTELAGMLSIDKETVADIEPFFNLTINEITEFEKSEINQEFFDKAFGPDNVKSEEEFTEKIKANIAKAYEQESDFRFSVDAKEKLIERYNPKLPEEFLKRWLLETDKEGKLTEEKLEEEFDDFTKDLKWRVINNRVAEAEKFEVTEEELKEESAKFTQAQMQQYGIDLGSLPPETLDQFISKNLEKPEDRNKFTEKVIENKVVNFIKENVKLDDSELDMDEFKKLYE